MEECSNSERDRSDERDIRKFLCHLSRRTTSFSEFSHQTAVRPGRIQNRRRRRWQAMYVLGVKAVERLLTSVQFFASALRYRKAVVFVNTNRPKAFALT